MANIVTIDFETYYNKTKRKIAKDGVPAYRMPYQIADKNGIAGVAHYVNNPKFQLVMTGLQVNGGPVQQAIGIKASRELIKSIDWENSIMVAHNARLEAYILHRVFKVQPAWLVCTLSMARAIGLHQVFGSASLDSLTGALAGEIPNLIQKGTEVKEADGIRLEEMSEEFLAAYARYNQEDVTNTTALYHWMRPQLDKTEMVWQDTVTKMYARPRLLLDKQVLRGERERIMGRINEAVASTGYRMEDLGSNPKFAAALLALGAEVPMKISETTGKEAPALAKDDLGFQQLQEHPYQKVRDLCEARIAVKGSGTLNRIDRLLALAELGNFAVPLVISGAITGRCGGDEKINLQSLPSGRVEGQTNAIRAAIVAPPGKVVVVGDLSGIEPRALAVASNDIELLDMYREGVDPYCIMASSIFGKPYGEIKAGAKAGNEEFKFYRQVGKAAILQCGYGAWIDGFWVYLLTTAKVNATREDAEKAVKAYRNTRWPVVQLWRRTEQALVAMADGQYGTFGGADGKLITYDGSWLVGGQKVCRWRFADAPWIVYPSLRYSVVTKYGKQQLDFRYYGIDPKSKRPSWVKIYPAKAVENIIQSAGGYCNKLASNRCLKFMDIVLSVHDETVGLVDREVADEAVEKMVAAMSIPPHFAPYMPITGEASWGESYGDAK